MIAYRQNPKGSHPADGLDLIPLAIKFAASLYHGGTHIKREASSLDEARTAGDALVKETGSARRCIIYALLEGGRAVPVPSDYQASTNEQETTMLKRTAAAKKAPKTTTRPASRSTARKAPATTGRARVSSTAPGAKKNKSEIVEAMLKTAKGATREELSKATGWPHVNLKVAAERAGMKLVEGEGGRFRLVGDAAKS